MPSRCCWRPQQRQSRKNSELIVTDIGDTQTSANITYQQNHKSGNPRNKCALQPGHSLMDWIRLGASGRDLTGVGHRAGTLSITPHQLSEHSTPSDAWIAIRGRVYNVTHYLPFHPGGPEELMRGAGRDATKLFDQVHAWVNYEQILQKCYIGRLVSIDPDELDTVDNLFGGSSQSKSTSKQNSLTKQSSSAPTSPQKSLIIQNDLFSSSIKLFNKSDESTAINNSNCEQSNQQNVILPKFDWIQKSDCITFIFYTKSYSNCEILIQFQQSDNDKNINLIIQLIYDNKCFKNALNVKQEIKWPCRTQINYETGKCEIIFMKLDTFIWPCYGTIQQEYQNQSICVCDTKEKFLIVDKIKLSHNVYLILIRRFNCQLMNCIPIGKHIRVYLQLKGHEHSRSYTPVPPCIVKRHEPTNYSTDCLCLMIKSYSQGLVSSAICNIPIGHTIEVSPSAGGFRLSHLEFKEYFLLIAAGTGITPMLSLLLFLLQRRSRRCQRVKLLFFNRTEKDIVWRDQFDTLMKEDNRFIIEHILSDANDKWQGKRGRINFDLIQDSLEDIIKISGDTSSLEDLLAKCYVCVCGPSPFTQATEKILKEIQIDGKYSLNSSQIHCFLG